MSFVEAPPTLVGIEKRQRCFRALPKATGSVRFRIFQATVGIRFRTDLS